MNFYWLDVFTQQRFGGNPLAVVFGGESLSQAEMQRIAFEFNLSETTFVLPPDTSEQSCRVRIFTPSTEIPFAGHPTLGTAYAVRKHWQLKAQELILQEGVGAVPVRFLAENHLELTIAVTPEYQPLPISIEELADFTGLEASEIVTDLGEPQVVSCGLAYTLVPLKTLTSIQKARYSWDLNHPLLHAHPVLQELYLFTRETVAPAMDFHVRMFAPAVGVPEDPATGSAAATLAAWLQKYNPVEQAEYWLEQGLEIQRPSQLGIRLSAGQIHVQGYVSEVMQGQIFS